MNNLIHVEDLHDLWNLFFYDSSQAMIMVNAESLKIVRVNDALLEIVKKSESDLIGQSWKSLDQQINHDKYNGYIKEITINETVIFNIIHKSHSVDLNLKAQYQMGVLDGEIIYFGTINPEVVTGISLEVYQQLSTISNMSNKRKDIEGVLEQIRKSLKFSFMLFVEFHGNKLKNSASTGDIEKIKDINSNSKHLFLELLKSNEELLIDKSLNKLSDYIEILNQNNLQTFCVFPIHHQNKTYGAIIAGGHNKVDNWRMISVLINALTNQCKFNLFQKSIVEQREIEGQVDKLTGLLNRNAMTNKFAKIVENGISSDKYISLMIIDIDRLNYLNKNIGIEFTNELIVCIAQLIVKNVRSKGQVFRLSGDEFMVLFFPHENKKLAETLVADLISKLDKPILLSNGEDMLVNFNIGISIFPDDGQTASSMMKNADLAMYDAKLAGKNNYVVFKYSETGQALKQKTEMVENLKNAIKQGHITAFFQPKINAQTEDVIGFEALVRWIDPEIGLINPGHFIPLAEETGLINEIGEYVAKFSCEMLVQWQKKYGLALSCSINLSAVQLMDPKLPKKLEAIINSSGVHPHYIDFEITETISLDEVPNLVDTLNEIVELGCTLSIDDFGTGHSSLDYVKRIPAKYIKIDQSFVKNIGLNPEDEAILDATVNIAKRLNREIVAEGVETEEQREYLLDRECEYFQGFLFARPMPIKEVEILLTQRVKLMGSNQ